MEVHGFDEVEPDPSVQTVLQGAQVAEKRAPDWIVGLGGGSSLELFARQGATNAWDANFYPLGAAGAGAGITQVSAAAPVGGWMLR